MAEFHFVHYENPMTYKGPRSGQGRMYTDPTYRKYRARLVASIRQEMKGRTDLPFKGQLKGVIIYDRKTAHRIDLDNLTKPVKDALQMAGVIDNDSQFIELTLKKFVRASVPKTIVQVMEVGA